MKKKPLTLKNVNICLYKALLKLFASHINNDGNVDFSEKEYLYISNVLDEVEILYFKKKPDGDNQNKLSEDLKSGELEILTDEQAYTELITRFQNTDISKR